MTARSRVERRWLALGAVALLLLAAVLLLGPYVERQSTAQNVSVGLVKRADPVLQGRPPCIHAETLPVGRVEATLVAGECSSVLVRVDDGSAQTEGATAFVSSARLDAAAETIRQSLNCSTALLVIPETWFVDERSIQVRVGIAGGGLRKQTRDLALRRGMRAEVGFVLDRGLALSGRVVTADGEPVPGLRVVARPYAPTPGIKSTGKYASDRLLFSGASFFEGRGETSAEGAFRVSGLRGIPYYLTTSDLDWMLLRGDAARTAVPPQGDLTLVAERTYRLTLHLRDATTGAAVPYARVRFMIESEREGDYYSGFVCRDGVASVALAARGLRMRGEQGIDIPIRVQAFGFEDAQHTISYGPGEREIRASMELTPVPLGHVEFSIRREDGLPCGRTGGFRAVFSNSSKTYSLDLDAAGGEGAFECAMVVGDWTCRVQPKFGSSFEALAWSGHVRVPARGVARVPVDLPAYALLTVDGWQTDTFGIWLESSAGRIFTGISEGHHTFCVPVGPLSYRACDDGKEFHRGTVELLAGAEIRIAVTREGGLGD